MLRALALAVLALALTACGSSEPSAPETNTTPTAPDPAAEECARRLAIGEAAAFGGAEPQPPVATKVGELPACRWDLEAGEWVQLVDVPAHEWAAELPALIAQVEASGGFDEATRRKLTEGRMLIESGKPLTPAQACGLFTTMAVSIQGAPEGSDHVVNFLPNPQSPQAVNAQRCVDGRYTSVQLVSPDLVGTEAEVRRAEAALVAVGP